MDTKSCALVTGAGRGIGRAIALRMAQEGPVVLVGRTMENLVHTSKLIKERGSAAAELISGDVRDPETSLQAVCVAEQRGWTVRHAIANAGIGKSGAIEKLDWQLVKDVMDVNIDGAFHLVRACLPRMLQQGGGTIVLMSSVSGLAGSSHDSPYVVSKHALIGLARSLAKEHGKRGIVAVPVCPGFVESEMTERSVQGYAERHKVSHEEARRKIALVNPQCRIIPAEEVAEMVAFVCSGKVPSLSGSPLVLSGGV